MQSSLKGELFTDKFINLGHLFIRKGHKSQMVTNCHNCYGLNTKHWKVI